VVKVFWHKAASPPHTDRSVVFRRWRDSLHSSYSHGSLGPREPVPQRACRSIYRVLAGFTFVTNRHTQTMLYIKTSVAVGLILLVLRYSHIIWICRLIPVHCRPCCILPLALFGSFARLAVKIKGIVQNNDTQAVIDFCSVEFNSLSVSRLMFFLTKGHMTYD